MKTLVKISILLMAFLTLGWAANNQDKLMFTSDLSASSKQSPTPGNGGAPLIPGAITLKLKKGTGDFAKQTGLVHFGIQSLDDKVAMFGISGLEKRFRYNPARLRADLPDLSRIYKISFPETFSPEEVAAAFASDPTIEYAEPIPVEYFADVPDDFLYDQLQHLPQIWAPQAWDIHKGENGTEDVVIAINDSGVDWDHEDLQSNIWQNLAEDADGDGHTMEYNGTQWVPDPGDLNAMDDDQNGYVDDLFGWNFRTNTGDPNPDPTSPDYGHGTHCAGIAAGVTNNHVGIASITWNLKVMPVCVEQGGGILFGYDGIIYAAENGADIISNSWGGSGYSVANQEVVNYAAGLGSMVLACAHNYNNSILIYPASYKNVISVAAVDANDTKTPYSNYNLAVDISAPGGVVEQGILSTVPDNLYERYFGTSMATPMVAGCLGLLKSYSPEWSNNQLITQLLGTTDNLDSLNMKFVNMLGTGRLNAYRMLIEENVLPYLKLDLLSFTPADGNGNAIIEPGEVVILNFDLQNYSQAHDLQPVTASVTTNDPDISIVAGTCNAVIPADTSFSIKDQLQIQVSGNSGCHVAKLILHIDADIPIQMGQDIEVEIMVAPAGILVFEGEEQGIDQSGKMIAGFLDRLGFNYYYTNSIPSLFGFESAFLSFGNFGENMDHRQPFTERQSLAIQQFLEAGGNLFVEMGGMFYRMNTAYFSNRQVMKQLFGVSSFTMTYIENPVDTLLGVAGTPTEGMLFAGSRQVLNWHIDKLVPASTAVVAFYEQGFGNVALMNDGSATYGHKTFYLGYSLADLNDRDPVSSGYNILLKVMDFFGYDISQEKVITNFKTDKTAGSPPLKVNFTDISIGDPVYPVSSWQWDFNNDGIIDSQAQNPSWTYNDVGVYEVRLVTGNGMSSDTLLSENLIFANAGYLVYEGVAGGADYSGTFIRDYLEENAYTVTYRNLLPRNLDGFDAIFLSFGNYGSGKTVFDDRIALSVERYLETGGYVYLEGGDALGFDQAGNEDLLNLFAVEIVDDGFTNPVSLLSGRAGAITEGLEFMGNSQVSNAYIDRYQQLSPGMYAITEDNYAKVAVQQINPAGRRTFCFSYALSCLTDGEYPNTRVELLSRILNFFDIYTGEEELHQTGSLVCRVYPNPFRLSACFEYSLDEDTPVTLSVYNQQGLLVGVVVNNTKSKGVHQQSWDASGLPDGIYFYRLLAGNDYVTGKIVLVR